MSQRVYNLIYAIYFGLFGWQQDYQKAKSKEFNKFAIEMLEKIQNKVSEPKQ